MKLTLAEPKYLKESITIISELVNEASFKITKDAIELVAMDPANVAMVIFKLLSSSFTEYNVENEVDLAVNLSNIKQILRRAKPNDMISLELEGNEKLKITLQSNTLRTFYIPIIELEEREQKIPDLNFPVTVSATSSTFNDAIEDVDVVAESVVLAAEPGKFNLIAEGDLSKVNVEIKESEDTKITAEDSAKAKYSIEYLKKMINGSKLADQVTINLGKDYPLKITYTVIDKVLMSFILAPRVDND
tara:strand:- start:131 stop:871 length:741 start_codon:yes stop_codon:yes gene_type:complete